MYAYVGKVGGENPVGPTDSTLCGSAVVLTFVI